MRRALYLVSVVWDYAPWQCWRQGHRYLPCLRRERRIARRERARRLEP